jgi:5-dehydro-2-deoxygluconokinase
MRIVADAASRCDVVVGNDEEFGLIAGSETTPLEAATRFVRDGCHFVILKRGNAGSITVTADETFETGIFAVDAKKPFGSGDAFLGCLIVGLCRGVPLEAAVRRATAGAAYVVSRRGCAFAMPTASELQSFILNHPSK